MSVISNFPAMPNRIAIACEYLHFLGEDGGALETVEKQLSPLQNSEGEDGVGKTSKTSLSGAVLSEMEKLKLIKKSRERVALLPDIWALSPRDGDWQKTLKPLLFERLTSYENADSYGQPDLPGSISWLLSQDPVAPLPWAGGAHVKRIISQLGENDSLQTDIGNNARYQNLVYWSRYLGFAERISMKGTPLVVSDPTEALSLCLPAVFKDVEEMPIEPFIKKLAEICPVLDGGVARQQLQARMSSQFQVKENHLSCSTSLALFRLHRRSVLSLRAVSDAKTYVLECGETAQRVSHVALLGRASA